MVEVLARNWGWVALRGVAGILFGLLTLINPALSFAALLALFGAYALIDGIVTAVAAVANRRDQPHWAALLIGGILGIVVGLLTFFLPGVTAIVLLFLIAVWAIIIGVAAIVAAIRLRRVIAGEWLLGVAGALAIALGIILFASPAVGALAMVLWIGIFAILFGVAMLALALRLRQWQRERHGGGAAGAV